MNPVTRTAGIVVIGAGHAGSTLVIELRKLGYEGLTSARLFPRPT